MTCFRASTVAAHEFTEAAQVAKAGADSAAAHRHSDGIDRYVAVFFAADLRPNSLA